MKPLDMTADPGCPTGPQPAEVVVSKDGKLANVFVYVKEGFAAGQFCCPHGAGDCWTRKAAATTRTSWASWLASR